MRILRLYVRVVDAISEWLGWLSMILVIATVAVGFYNVLVRYLGRFIGVQLSSNLFIELQWYLFSLVFFFSFAYILKHGINVRVDFIYAKWSKERKAKIDFWGHLIFLVPFCIIAIWFTINPVLSSWGLLSSGRWTTWELSPDPGGLPRAPLKSMIIVAFTMLLLQITSELIKLYYVMGGRGDLFLREELEKEAPLRIE
jgi:TRAP-type mannitol/chloroaromatic compound transport system permease small subunit